MTLFTLDERNQRLIYSSFYQLIFSIFCAVFGAIYEVFSHEVYSFYMIYAFMIPLVLGVFAPMLVMFRGKRAVSPLSLSFWNMAVATFTVGSLYKGVIEIYGTTNKMAVIYPIAGATLILMAVITHFFCRQKQQIPIENEVDI